MQNNYNTHDQNNNSFTPTFFIVPFYILNLPGLTLGYLKVYETIFQFWNKGHNCFLSNSAIKLRTDLGLTQIKEALNYFEKNGQLKRVIKGTKRYIIQPERPIEYDCAENIQVAAPPARGGRSTGHQVAAPPATEIKNINKETTTTTTTSSSINVELDISSPECTNVQELNTSALQCTKPVVVVSNFSDNELTSYESNKLTEVFNENPIETAYIKNLEDFLSAALYSLLNREAHIARHQRLKGIISLMQQRRFEEPPSWTKDKKSNKGETLEERNARYRLERERELKRRNA